MEPFKNRLSFEKALEIGAAIQRAYPAFSLKKFREGLEVGLEPLELKARVNLIADYIEAGLVMEPAEVCRVLVQALTAGGFAEPGFKNFLIWPLTEVVSRQGVSCFSEAMEALAEMTQHFTAEWTVRRYVREMPELTFAQFHRWCEHPNEHVRRLVSEGCRPFLPWGEGLPELLEEPFPTLDLLERLYRDESDYVRLSVSNHLNDFSKEHPELVVDLLGRWLDESAGDQRVVKLARHACRTLLKQGHAGALALHGYEASDRLELSGGMISPKVKLGGALEYELKLRNTGTEGIRVMFDFAIHHLKANGSLAPKVFKGRIRELAAGEEWVISGRHAMKRVTTRVYYPGLHRFEPRINGRAFPAMDFQLEM